MSQPNAKNEAKLGITALAYGAHGIGRVNGRVWMVPHTAPGDQVIARAIEDRERFVIAEAIRILSPSSERRVAPCAYAGRCGGCSWQHIHYQAQLRAKQQSVDDALRRIGKLSAYEIRPIIPAAEEFHYRRRIRLHVGPDNSLGFYAGSSHELLQIDACAIANERLNRILPRIRRWAGSLSTTLEDVEIVAGDDRQELVIAARAARPLIRRDEATSAELIEAGSGISGLIVAGTDGRHVWGEPRIRVDLGEIVLHIDADVFTQVNAAGNRLILDELLRSADFADDDRVLELYCGAGNFTLPIARRAQSVVAVEGHRAAIDNAKLNGQRNGLDNVRWICASVPSAVSDLKRKRQRFGKIVLDPPRSGAKGIEQDLATLGAEKIFYISCNPTTLARDVATLAKLGYKLGTVQPIDLFPQTFHVETLAALER